MMDLHAIQTMEQQLVKGGLQHTDTNKTMLAGCLSDLRPGMGAVIALCSWARHFILTEYLSSLSL